MSAVHPSERSYARFLPDRRVLRRVLPRVLRRVLRSLTWGFTSPTATLGGWSPTTLLLSPSRLQPSRPPAGYLSRQSPALHESHPAGPTPDRARRETRHRRTRRHCTAPPPTRPSLHRDNPATPRRWDRLHQPRITDTRPERRHRSISKAARQHPRTPVPDMGSYPADSNTGRRVSSGTW